MGGVPDPEVTDPSSEATALVLKPVLAGGLSDARRALGERLFVPQINWSALPVSAFSVSGSALACSGSFPQTDPEDVAQAWRARSGPFAALPVRTKDGSPTLIALMERDAATRWALDDNARAILATPEASIAGFWMSALGAPAGLAWACDRLGLTALQARTVTALVCSGDLRAAAERSGVAYATAREALAGAMARAGVNKRAALIDRVVRLSFGILPDDIGNAEVLTDIWGLTQRQARLAVALAQGAARDDAAKAAGVSAAVAKKELSVVFETLGVSSGSALSAHLSEAAAITALARLVADDIHFAFDRLEPLRLVPASARSRTIAISDYGPRTGKPVLVLHSSSASRQVPSALLTALHSRGFRPFSIDRPGFGLTDALDIAGDPFALACDDIRTICDVLGFSKIDVIARGGAQVAVHLGFQSPERVGRVILVAPDPPNRISKPMTGILGVLKLAFQANPHLTEMFAKVVVSNLRNFDARELMHKAVGASAPDVKVMEDPRNFADYRRGFQMFLSGRLKGYAREQAALVTEPDPPAPRSTRDWRVFIGAHDPLHDPDENERYWRNLLPDASIDILSDGGRFIVVSHAEQVADALLGDVSGNWP